MFAPVTHPSRKTVLKRNRINKVLRELSQVFFTATLGNKSRSYWEREIKNDPYRQFPWQ